MRQARAAEEAYRPGECNIGASEVRLRWLVGHLGIVVTIGLFAWLVVIGASPVARLALALPAAGAAFSYLEAISGFCGSFGVRGVYNFGRVGAAERVDDPAARRADRRRALRLTAQAIGIGFIAGLLAAALPV